jgi:peptidyl-prolyl cis-trans isomerase A (cyclophilin A)
MFRAGKRQMHRAASKLLRPLLALCLASAVACGGDGKGPYDSKTDKKDEKGAKTDGDAKKAGGDAKKADDAGEAPEADPKLLDPTAAVEEPPDSFKVKFETTKGDFVVEVTKSWAPNGAKRFFNLVKLGYFTDVAFFRAVEDFMVQFGIHGNPQVNGAWRSAKIKDDPVKESNKKGHITFATSGPDSRTVQMFINFKNNANLDGMGFAPFGKVVEGMDVVEKLHTGYGDSPPNGRGPNQGQVQSQGNAYLKKDFPELDYIKTATLVE